MISIKPPTKLIGAGWVASAATFAWAAAWTKKGSPEQALGLLLGAAGAVLTGLAWREKLQELEILKHPELMNGHFLTGGSLSAVHGDPAEIAALGDILEV